MRRWLACGLVIVGVFVGVTLWRDRGDGHTHLIVPNVLGAVALLRTAEGHTLLLDGGADAAATASWLGHELPFYQRHFDLVLLTRADAQTLPGQIATLQRYSAQQIGYVAPVHADPSFAVWQTVARSSGRLAQLRPGLQFQLGTTKVVVLRVQDGHAALRIDVDRRTIYALESLDEAGLEGMSVQVDRPVDLLLFGWQVRPSAELVQRVQPGAVIYMPGGQTLLQQSFAERWSPTMPLNRLFHPAVHGRIDWRIDARKVCIMTERYYKDKAQRDGSCGSV